MSLKKFLIGSAIAIFSLALIFNFANSGESSDDKSNVDSTENSEIVFFWLPSGEPCKQQDKTLQEMEKDYPNLKVTRVDVTNPNNSSMANKYGIRSVPAIVVLDKSGKTIKQFAPGIQTEATLKQYIN